MSPPIVIRPLEPGDVDAVHAILRCPGVLPWTIDEPGLTRDDVVRAYFTANPIRERHERVAVRGDRAVAHGGFSVSLRPRIAHVGTMYIAVHDDAQGQGIGRILMTELVALGDAYGLRRLELNVHAGNARAIALYKSLGFVEEGRLRGQVRCGDEYVDSLVMGRWRSQQ